MENQYFTNKQYHMAAYGTVWQYCDPICTEFELFVGRFEAVESIERQPLAGGYKFGTNQTAQNQELKTLKL
ncbi:MAG: hypothetical protein M9898_11515 [Chitinophagaceae bacterium]|nr:hypothetical protein [Chitinophagaceae bacterium]